MGSFKNGIDENIKHHMIKDLDQYLGIALMAGDEEEFIAVLAGYIQAATHYQSNPIDIFDDAVDSFIHLSADHLEMMRDFQLDTLSRKSYDRKPRHGSIEVVVEI